MSTPWRLAAWMMVSPASALTVSPFSLKSMVSVFPTGSFIFMSDLVREVLHDAADGIGRRLAQAADGCIGHGDVQVLQQRLVPLRRFHEMRGLRGADAARRALPARLVLEEPHQVQRRVARLVVLRQDDHRR